MAGTQEGKVEKYLDAQVQKELGGITRKWVSPGRVGVPDRIVILPGGRVLFVEVKTETGALSPMQKRELQRLRDMGADTRVVYGEKDVDQLIEVLK